MSNSFVDFGISLLMLLIVIGGYLALCANYEDRLEVRDKEIIKLHEAIDNVNEARIRAENKPCCVVVQERYDERMIDEEGLFYDYTTKPTITWCE